MKSIEYMDELNSTKILQEVGTKLPPYTGTKWCRHTCVFQRRGEKEVSFHDLVKFVKEEANLAMAPIFSPESFKRERLKTTERSRFRSPKPKAPGASSFASSSTKKSNTPSGVGPLGGRRLTVPQADIRYVEEGITSTSGHS